MVPESLRRLNWGCGGHVAPGWINCDQSTGHGIDISCSILDGLPIGDNDLDYAVSIHALQEIPFDQLGQALRELWRVLRPGGVLRLCLPDIFKGVAAAQRGDRDYFQVPDEDARSIGAKLVVQLIWYGYSRTLFNDEFIEEVLLKAGFREIRHCKYRETESEFPEIVVLDNREQESLFVEAVK